ncbi:hypothetical protein [Haladaptatus halobius]|nr:hypothetical protein [Haladaptatus halobius]
MLSESVFGATLLTDLSHLTALVVGTLTVGVYWTLHRWKIDAPRWR